MRYIVALLSVIVLVSCIPYSENPLTPPDREKIDRSVTGTWYWKENNGSGYLHIGIDDVSGMLDLLMVDLDSNSDLDVSAYKGHTSEINGNRYLNIKEAIPGNKASSHYLLVKYEVKQGRFGIALMDNDTVENAVKEGSLRGKDLRDDVLITESPEGLRKFILENDSTLFPEMKYLKRLDLPD